MKIIIWITFFILVGITLGILTAIGRSIFDHIKNQFSNSTFLVYHKSNQKNFPVELEKNEGGNFVAVLSQKYTQDEIQKLVNDGVLIRATFNFNQVKKLSSFRLGTAYISGNQLVMALLIIDSNENKFAPIFINKKDFEMAAKIAIKI
jgi:hypothetical protein